MVFVCPPEGGLGSSWLKHASKQRSPTTLIGVVRVVVVLVLERVFVVVFGFSVHAQTASEHKETQNQTGIHRQSPL
jgi:hypothetical protein